MKKAGNIFWLIFAAFLLSGCASAPFQGKLDKLRQATRKKKKNSRPRESRGSRCGDFYYQEEEEERDPLEELEAGILEWTFLLPFTLPQAALDDLGFRRQGWFLERPYAYGESGGMVFPYSKNRGRGKGWKADLALENGNDFHGLDRTGLTFLVDTSSRIGFSGRLDYYRELGSQDLIMGVADVTLRFAQGETAQFRTGLGVRFWGDENGGEAGLDFLYAADFQPGDPWLLSLEFHAGNLGDAWAVEGRGVLGFQLGGLRLQGGYQHLNVGGVDLYGPFLGAGLSF
ncbi:MAG TPA: hypothetical protein ENJ97_05150 [Planctomycetes bacterium]|nr:hypothetical protein [Planctomycetota bacterium]